MSKFFKRVFEGVLIKFLADWIVGFLPSVIIILFKLSGYLSKFLNITILNISNYKIDIFYFLLTISIIYFIIFIVKKFKSKSTLYLIKYNHLKWLVQKYNKSFIISDIPFCPEHNTELVTETWAHFIVSAYCPICKRQPANVIVKNISSELQNILDSKGLHELPSEKYKGHTIIKHTDYEFNIGR